MKSQRIISLSIIVYCSLLFVYILLRALNLSLTYDEVVTMQITTGPARFEFAKHSNNHLLNTLLIKGGLQFMEPYEFALRLPNVLAFILYLVFAVKLSKLIKPSAPYLPLVLLTAMPFLLDFFSLARGYGLVFGFVMGSIYYLLKFSKDSSFKYGVLTLTMAILASLSNFSGFNYFLPFICVFLFLAFRPKHLQWKWNLIYIGITGLFFSLVIPMMFELKANDQFYYGGRRSFYHDTILSQGRTFAYHQLDKGLGEVLVSIIFYVSLFLCLVAIIRTIKKKSIEYDVVLAALFGLGCISVIAQNYIFQTNFPFERTALIFFILQILILSTGIKDFKPKIQKAVIAVFATIFLSQTIYSLNVDHCYSWKFEAGTKEVFEEINRISNENQGQPISLGVNYLLIPDTWYYQWKHELHNLTFKEMTECGDFNLRLEEMDPTKFGSVAEFRDELNAQDIEDMKSYDMDYYYLHDVVVEEIKRHGHEINIIVHTDYAGSSLISFK